MGGSYCRPINIREREALFNLWLEQMGSDGNDIEAIEAAHCRMDSANFTVVDGYVGNIPVLFVVYDDGPEFYESYTWDRANREWRPTVQKGYRYGKKKAKR